LEEETLKLANKIAKFPSTIISLGKRAFYEQIQLGVEKAYKVGESCMVENLLLEDSKEGISAFVQKRDPIFFFKNE